ncbi:MAG: HlyD family type I secretion periplasmic adaptor subunit [Magnetospirillum sp.]|nr:HlyD family type I secretion periplasmic adaptor subunit [Magnetospirillum sp.]
MTEQSPLPPPLPPAPPQGPDAREQARALLRSLKAVLRWLGPQPDPRSEAQPLSRRLRALALDAWRWLLPGGPVLLPAAEERHHAAAQGGRLLALSNSYPLPTWRPLARAVMVALALFIVWALLASLDEVAIASGEVVPEGKVKVIQHLEGGVVREISVAEGQEVKEGTPLMQLDLSATSINRDELQVRLDGLTLQRARLRAEVAGSANVDFPADEAKRQPVLLASEQRNFDSRRQALRATLAVLQDQARQKQLEVQELETRQRALASNLRLSRERLAMSNELMKSGLTAKMEHVALQGQVEELEGQLESVRASIPRAQAGGAEAKSRIEEEQARFVRTAQGELSEVELNVARTRELLSQASDQQRRTQITSPIDGIVKNLRANTIGGVVKAGDPIMEIVPLHERLQIDAKLNPADRGYVQAGQKAMVKLSAYDYTTYGGLEGDVILVAPDTTIGQDNQPYYRVVVQTGRAYLGDDTQKRPITAGMQATVDIHTGTRTVMEYLIKPVLKLRHEAFRER